MDNEITIIIDNQQYPPDLETIKKLDKMMKDVLDQDSKKNMNGFFLVKKHGQIIVYKKINSGNKVLKAEFYSFIMDKLGEILKIEPFWMTREKLAKLYPSIKPKKK